jgi:HTH-type transcriptional regulator/antitoxin HigA
MAKIENEAQYNWALSKIEELLQSTDEKTPAEDPTMIELKLLSDLVADYSDEHYSIDLSEIKY